jgi:hypothetical protein
MLQQYFRESYPLDITQFNNLTSDQKNKNTNSILEFAITETPSNGTSYTYKANPKSKPNVHPILLLTLSHNEAQNLQKSAMNCSTLHTFTYEVFVVKVESLLKGIEAATYLDIKPDDYKKIINCLDNQIATFNQSNLSTTKQQARDILNAYGFVL